MSRILAFLDADEGMVERLALHAARAYRKRVYGYETTDADWERMMAAWRTDPTGMDRVQAYMLPKAA